MKTIATGKNFKTLAKMGYLSRGAVYLVIGGLALLTAFGKGGETTDSKGAITTIMEQPFGEALLVLLVIGLFGYVVWRFTQAVKDTDGHGKSAKGIAIRSGLLVSGLTHAALAFWAIGLLVGDSSGGNSNATGYLGSSVGRWIFALAGIAIATAGIAQIIKGWLARFEKYMVIPADKKSWAKPICRLGLIARGIVWCIMGWFLTYSAIIAGNGRVTGISDALNFLREQNYGSWLFTIAAAGLFCFGIYSVLEAIYRRIDVEPQLSFGALR